MVDKTDLQTASRLLCCDAIQEKKIVLHLSKGMCLNLNVKIVTECSEDTTSFLSKGTSSRRADLHRVWSH